MKKIAMLTALLATTTIVSFAKEEKVEVKGNPLAVESKEHAMVHAKEHKSPVRTPEQFAKKKEKVLQKLAAKIAATREEVKKAKVAPEIIAEAEMKIQCAQNWHDAIKEYKDPATRFRRSQNYAYAELNSAIATIKQPLKPSKLDDAAMSKMIEHAQNKHNAAQSAKLDEATMNKMVADLGAPIKEVVQLSETIKVYEENDTCFKKILETADSYIKLATLHKDKVHFRQIIKRAKRLIKDAHKFLEDHKVDSRHRADAAHAHVAAKPSSAAASSTQPASPAAVVPAATSAAAPSMPVAQK